MKDDEREKKGGEKEMMNEKTERCEDWRELLPDYLEKRLSGSERAVVEEHLSFCEDCFNAYFSLVEEKVKEEKLPPYLGGRPAWGPLAWSLDRERDLVEEIFEQALQSEENESFEPILIKGDETQRTSILFMELRVGAKLREKDKNLLFSTPTTKGFLSLEKRSPEEVRYMIVDSLSRFSDRDDFLMRLKEEKIVLIGSIDCQEATFKDLSHWNPKIFSLRREDSEVKRYSEWHKEGLEEERERFLQSKPEVKNIYRSLSLLDRVGVPAPLSLLGRLTKKEEKEILALINQAQGLIYKVEVPSRRQFFCTRAKEIAEGILKEEYPNEDLLVSKYKELIEVMAPEERVERITMLKLLYGLIYYSQRGRARKLLEIMEDSGKAKVFREKSTLASELLGWGRIYHQLRMYEEAKEVFEEARKIYPENIYLLHASAKMMADWRKYEEAEELFKSALSLQKDNIYILQTWGDMEAKRTHTHWPTARGLFKEALKIDKENIYTRVSYGNLELRAQDYEKAEEYLGKAIEIDKENLYALCSLGVLEKERLKYKEAGEYFKQVFKLDPRNVVALNARGMMEKERGHLKEAEGIFKETLEIEPENLHSRHSLAEIMLEKGEYEEAERLFEKVLCLDPDNLHTGISRGVMWMRRGDYKQAEESFKKAEKIDDRSPYLYSARAEILARQGKDEDARYCFGEAIRISGEEEIETVPIYNNIAKMWQRKGDLKKARDYLSKSQKLKPKGLIRIITLNTRADVETGAGNYEEAERLYEESLSLDEENAYTCLSYAKMFRKQGRQEETKKYLQKAKELGLETP